MLADKDSKSAAMSVHLRFHFSFGLAASDNSFMPFDSLVANPGRLRILVSLAQEPTQEFVQLRSATKLTDGNLSTHAKRLHSAGMLAIEKTFRAGKPVTTLSLTRVGREALESHANDLLEALRIPKRDPTPAEMTLSASSQDDDWVD
jgi:DNA-binding MarR family transcriptional regulator